MGPPRPRGAEKNKRPIGDPKPKKPKKQPKEQPKEQQSGQPIPFELQQLLLNIFKNCFLERLQTDIHPLLQEVKGHLYNRDFLAAFGRNDYLEAYAARWSPSRVLGFLQVFVDLKDHIVPSLEGSDAGTEVCKKAVCLRGGGGAEIVAWAGFLNAMQRSQNETGVVTIKKLEVVSIDIANWTSVIETLYTGITTAPPISKYASAAAQAANVRLVNPEAFIVRPHQADILNIDFSVLGPLLHDADIITIMFTLNELYSTSLSLTQKFLLQLTACVREGALLLVGDSPGSYSSVSIDGTEKKYPMQWLLDHTLLRLGAKGEESKWVKVEEDESRWFRLREELKYPIDLENMRFQLHLYRRVG
ncbi:hypothetical protein K505DRAFT_328231 [Melanomma pulvis-pyrius CBS 109.77]|uniref:25S rRNA (Uridine(2843)-N(3))-methyltransferase n=1 Tax=Melanomma pulvis-pyrius CBS 109.77 TaxID=1314802 RepID=A0A6A6WZV8_9PLEO|nr:hypothetical protein K505DRAFT_328231 [Melanomma pulvis-pyrius CBS 109.77]